MESPASVLLVLPWSLDAAGGVNQVVLNLAREAGRRGRLRPIIFCADWASKEFTEAEREGVLLVSGRLRAPLSAQHPGRTLVAFLRDLGAGLRTWRAFIRRHNVQVINPHYVGLNDFIFTLLRGPGGAPVRLVYSLHGADLGAIAQSGRLRRSLMRWMLRRADGVTCCSDDLVRRTQQVVGLEERRLRTAYNGIDVEELEGSRTEDFRPDTPGFDDYLVNVATYEHKKGQDVLLQAFTQLVHEGLRSALVLIGRSTPYLASLRSKVRQLGLQGHVVFLPDLDHRRTLAAIRQARLLVQPSREEPFGITLLEAGYLGTPIVATRTGGIPEVLGSYYPYLAPPDNPAALAEMIDAALFNPTDVERETRLIRRRVTSQFTWGAAYRAYEGLWLGRE